MNNAKYVLIEVPVRFEDEQVGFDFPLRDGDNWTGLVELATGQIQDWPQGQEGDLYLKVVDMGTYTLIDEAMMNVGQVSDDYVPHGVVPGEYGDYIDLEINTEGTITNWTQSLDFSEFDATIPPMPSGVETKQAVGHFYEI